jgi:hypothetical protein
VSCIGSKGSIVAFIATFGARVTCFVEGIADAASVEATWADLPVDAVRVGSIAADEPGKLSCSF